MNLAFLVTSNCAVRARIKVRGGVLPGQLESTETRERKREREREGTPKTEVNIFDRAAHNKAIVF